MENSDISHLIDGNGMFRKGSSEEIEKLQLFEALQRVSDRNPELVDCWINAMEKRYEASLPKREKIEVPLPVETPVSLTVANPGNVKYSPVLDKDNKLGQKELIAAYR